MWQHFVVVEASVSALRYRSVEVPVWHVSCLCLHLHASRFASFCEKKLYHSADVAPIHRRLLITLAQGLKNQPSDTEGLYFQKKNRPHFGHMNACLTNGFEVSSVLRCIVTRVDTVVNHSLTLFERKDSYEASLAGHMLRKGQSRVERYTSRRCLLDVTRRRQGNSCYGRSGSCVL